MSKDIPLHSEEERDGEFISLVKKISIYPKVSLSERAQREYSIGSARAFYEDESWDKALENIHDPFSFFPVLESHLQGVPTSQTITAIINDLNTHTAENGLRYFVATEDTNVAALKRMGIDTQREGDLTDLSEIFAMGAVGTHQGNAQAVRYHLPDGRTISLHHSRPANATSIVVLNGKYIDENPMGAFVTLAHETGHAYEYMHATPKDIDLSPKQKLKGVIPYTERDAALWEIKASRMGWKKTGNEEFMKQGVWAALIYNRVMGEGSITSASSTRP